MWELLTKHHACSTVDGDGSGGTSLSQQGAETETSVPRTRVFDAGGAHIRFMEISTWVPRFLGQEATYRRRGDARGCLGHPKAPQARARGWPRLGATWWLWASSWADLLAPGVAGELGLCDFF